MRGTTIVEAVVALALGAGAGAGFIVGTGDLKGSSEMARLDGEKAGFEKQLVDHQKELARRQQLIADADRARVAMAEADERARAEADAKARAEADAKAREPVRVAEKLPAFGLLTIKALSGDLEVDGGPGLSGKGRSVDLAFESTPGKIKLKSAKFNVVITPKSVGRLLTLDVTVSPLAIITADGNRVGTSALGLAVDRKPFKLDFQSPAAGDLNLLLSFKK